MAQRTERLVDTLTARVLELTLRPIVHEIPADDPDAPPHKITEPKIDELLRRCRQVVAMDTERPVLDGFGTVTPGNGSPGAGKGGGRLMHIPADEHGPAEYVPTTSTEVAALNIGVPVVDPVHIAATRVVQLLGVLAPTLEKIDAELGKLERQRIVSKVPDPPQCWWIKQLGLPWDDRWEPWRATDFPKLRPAVTDEPVKVCKFVYWFARDNHRLPTKPEALQHLKRTAESRLAGQR